MTSASYASSMGLEDKLRELEEIEKTVEHRRIIAIHFDPAKVRQHFPSGETGLTCWKIFWKAVPLPQVRGSLLSCGELDATFCLTVSSQKTNVCQWVERSLLKDKIFTAVAAQQPLRKDNDYHFEPLTESLWIREDGTLFRRQCDWPIQALDALRIAYSLEKKNASATRPIQKS